jgi:two-component system, OmpR family, copper resistance phosphate regulon response regulator CusR
MQRASTVSDRVDGRTTPMRLLIVEDEQKVAMALREGLEGEGYEVTIASTGAEAFSRVNSDTFEIVLLDLTLPERDGLEILAAVRQRRLETRVLILTARDTLDDRVKGLDSGADDYLVKPFAFAELLARMRALERRGRTAPPPRLTVHDLEMDMRTRTVTRGSQVIDLTALEFELLEYLMRFEGEVVSRDTLARDVWHERGRSSTLDNVIDVHIARLRKKIDLDQPTRLIHTVRGVGFMVREGS